jgi:hypothetical protein
MHGSCSSRRLFYGDGSHGWGEKTSLRKKEAVLFLKKKNQKNFCKFLQGRFQRPLGSKVFAELFSKSDLFLWRGGNRDAHPGPAKNFCKDAVARAIGGLRLRE